MNNHNAIVILFTGNLPADGEITAIANVLKRQNMHFTVLSAEEIAQRVAAQVDITPKELNVSEELNRCVIYIGEKYSSMFSPEAFVTHVSHDLGNAYLRIKQFGAESELSKEAIALIRAVKILSTTKYSKLSRELCSKYDYTKEIHSLVNQIYSLYKNV